MKKQSFIFQMKLQEKTKTKTEKQLNELEMGNLPGKKKNQNMIEKMIQDLGKIMMIIQ